MDQPDPAIKAIPTEYRGHLFRSRLEARWAVFFDALKIGWRYEEQGYELASGAKYLPDFHLPDARLWVEVKGDEESFLEQGARYAEAAAGLGGSGLLLLGPVPDVGAGMPQHFVLTAHEHCCGKTVLCLHIAWWEMLANPGAVATVGFPCTCLDSHCLDSLPAIRGYNRGRAGYLDPGPVPGWPVSDDCERAYRAARSARFEHGRVGAML